MAEQHNFQAEIKQLLNILVHSLYTERDIFLRELISNAADALSKVQFEMLTNDQVLDSDAELGIHIFVRPEDKTIRIVDTGIGMNREELIQNLGTIAQSGAKAFLAQLEEGNNQISTDLIGQFGVGFYSVFMAADKVAVTSRSYDPDAEAFTWISSGEDTYEIEPSDKSERGTEVVIYLREDAEEFANKWKLEQVIRQHSDYIPFPIYVIDETADAQEDEEGESDEEQALQPVNQQKAIWRRSSSDIEEEEYNSFYRMLTLDFEEPLLYIHSQGDAPIQYYALLYIPHRSEPNMLSPRREDGLKLYARKVLIQEYEKRLLPDYLKFVHGVVDSEDIPLNVSRELVQSSPQMMKLQKVLTGRVLTELKRLSESDPEKFTDFWTEYSLYIKHGYISDFENQKRILPLLRFYTSRSQDEFVTLDGYIERMKEVEGQDAIYYIITESLAAASHSPHLVPFQERDIEVLYLDESVDGFLVRTLNEYEGHKLVNVDAADLDLEGVGTPPELEDDAEQVEQSVLDQLLVRIRNVLGEQVESVRESKVLFRGSPVRLVTPEGAIDRHTQRVYQMLDQKYEVPTRILEVNPRHPIIQNLATRLEQNPNDPDFLDNMINLLYENALLADGLHPNPSELAEHIQSVMEAATRLTSDE